MGGWRESALRIGLDTTPYTCACVGDPPPICPIKGWVLPFLVSQSLALESSTSQNLAVTDTLDYALRRPLLDKLLAMH